MMLTTIGAGNFINGNGVYDVEIERYHKDPKLCVAPSISASGCKVMADCPARYYAFSPYNPHPWPPVSTPDFDKGKAAHSLVLGEPEFAKYFVISPWDEFRKQEAKDWRDEQTKTIIKAEQMVEIQAMARAQRASLVVMNAFTNGIPEASVIYVDRETGVYVKTRPDWLPNDVTKGFLVDYKSAVSIEPRKLSSDVFRYGYHIQAAMQVDAVREVYGIEPRGIVHIVQEKKPPYLVDLRMFQPEGLELGRMLARKAIRKFAECMERGKWPEYTATPQYFETPAWVAKQQLEPDDDEFDNDASNYADVFNSRF